MFSEAEEDRDWRLYAADMIAFAVMTKMLFDSSGTYIALR